MCPAKHEDHSEIPAFDLSQDPRAQRVVIRSVNEVPAIFRILEADLKSWNFEYKDRFAIMLALREAANNAFAHGNQWDREKTVQVTFSVRPREVVVAVEDEGQGFDPKSTPRPFFNAYPKRGRHLGLFLMRAYTDWVTFSPRGNRVTFGRWRSET